MPQVIDKIRQNQKDFGADAHSMKLAFESGETTGEEIIDIGKLLIPGGGGVIGNKLLLEDGALHLAEQESVCEALHKALADCIKRQRALNDKRRRWLDAETAKL